MGGTPIDEVVPNDARPVAETHPDRLWVAARRAGLTLAVSETMRVLEVRCADVTTFDPGEATFDLVIAHGLFSWVPDPVRDAVLALSRRARPPLHLRNQPPPHNRRGRQRAADHRPTHPAAEHVLSGQEQARDPRPRP